MNQKSYFPLLFLLLILFLLYFLIKPLLSAILGSFILTFIFYKIFLFFNKKIKNKSICSALTILIILISIILPLFIVTNALAEESVAVYHKIDVQDIASLFSTYFEPYIETYQLQEYISSTIDNILLIIMSFTSNLILALPSFLVTFFVTIFLTYYLLKEADVFLVCAKKYLPLTEAKKVLILEKFRVITKALIFGHLFTALLQGILGGLGFFIFGIQSPILWGFIMAFTSLIPFLGTAFVWLPAGLIQLSQQNYTSGIGILLFGAVIVSTLDNIIRPHIVSKKADIHPAIVLIGILGGLKLLGFIGLVIGPLSLAIGLELLRTRGEFI